MAIMEISVVPLGEGPSVSTYVAKCVEIVQRSGLKYEVTAMGTIIEGDVEELFKIAKEMHKLPLSLGSKRVLTQIKIDERLDKTSSIEQKINSVLTKIS